MIRCYCHHDDRCTAEREILREQAQKSGKSANVIEKMVEGRLSKVSF